MDSNEKGHTLEKVVRAIEEMIIRETPTLRDAPFFFESRKRLVAQGVPLEIDLVVTVHRGMPYESVHIFECKNWATPVGPTEIRDFAEKIHAMGAQKGYFVARDFTTGARARAAQDPRMVLTPVTNDFVSPLQDGLFVASEHMILSLTVELTARNPSVQFGPLGPEFLHAVAFLNGRPLVLADYLNATAERAVSKERRIRARQFTLVGDHVTRITPGVIFEPCEFIIKGIDVAQVVLYVWFTVATVPFRIISQYEVSTRGRFYTYEGRSIGHPEMTVEIDLVQTLQMPTAKP
ncbi:MAG: restriction endonuclease [Opitutaceae bacterium]|nr:restriction endonuclease [Opitutaceae bacterium]